eukprot:4407994-Alexandrium_andersonii.AAC.1
MCIRDSVPHHVKPSPRTDHEVRSVLVALDLAYFGHVLVPVGGERPTRGACVDLVRPKPGRDRRLGTVAMFL